MACRGLLPMTSSSTSPSPAVLFELGKRPSDGRCDRVLADQAADVLCSQRVQNKVSTAIAGRTRNRLRRRSRVNPAVSAP